MTRQTESRRKRFRLVKLEERLVPSHLPAVAQVAIASPAAEHAPTHAHKVDFAVKSGLLDCNDPSGGPFCWSG